MKIIIVGNGKVGYAIARQLAVEGHDITMVDSSPVALARADSTLDIMCVEGNGASISVLEEAGARTADLVIAVSNLDETNLVCCLIAKTMGAKHTIARVRNPDYRRDAALLKREIGMDMVINPDLAAAREIARILSFPSASSVEPFAGGRIDMIGIQVTERDRFYGVALSEFHRIRSAEVLICAAQRGDECIIPNGNFVPREGDKLYMVGTKSELQKMLRAMGRTQQRVKTVSLLGGSRIAMYLTWELAVSNTKVCIVEQKHDKCLQLAAQLPTAMIIEGDGTEEELLTSENIFQADAFVSLTGRDEENLLMALTARRAGVPKVLAKMTRPNYMDLVRDMRVGSIVSPKDIVANQITRYVRALANSEGSAVESLYKMLGGAVEALEFTATARSRAVLNKPLRALSLKDDVLVAAIARGSEIIAMGRTQQRVKTVSLLGGSRIAMYLTWELAVSNTKVCIVEQKHDKCLQLAAQLPTAMIIEGDGTEEELLTSENIFQADAFVSLTGRDEENLLMALTARRAGVPKVLAKMTRPNYMDLVRDMRVGSIVSPKDIVANQITRYVRALANSEGSAVESLYKMLGGAVEALEFTATARSRAVLNKPLRALSLKDDVLVAAIARGSEIIIPGGTSIIQEGDHVVVVTNAHTFDDLGDILA